MIRFLVQYSGAKGFEVRKVLGDDVATSPGNLLFDSKAQADAVALKLNINLDHAEQKAAIEAKAELRAEIRALLGVA